MVKGTVNRVTWSGQEEESYCDSRGLVASGVEFLDGDGMAHVLMANKEVILSAGAVRSPMILEASGIGNPRYV
jgi:choline dehydrogenase